MCVLPTCHGCVADVSAHVPDVNHSMSVSNTHTHSLSLSLSHTHSADVKNCMLVTHTHTHTNPHTLSLTHTVVEICEDHSRKLRNVCECSQPKS